ncbi:unnamed protein product [Brugia pahangi]|uniref:Wsv136 n=1 Tax=Brugia pahangi TaxID=6280 RepID=A0A0N4TME9_BRUPA|nr:unnamed protein product [Brugia pahangi]
MPYDRKNRNIRKLLSSLLLAEFIILSTYYSIGTISEYDASGNGTSGHSGSDDEMNTNADYEYATIRLIARESCILMASGKGVVFRRNEDSKS